ncbi:MAG: phenylacetic acid degradation protein PaaN [Cyclobacteriaceae bacterium]|nr:phenylacetic acid degradation protein PaaN [Cyclobacteriaceae bacterium]MCH8517758.1 phenylacetic acid degradation protein PaaN [Cyclobacteriaceae bacterium]
MSLFEKHEKLIKEAVAANQDRTFYAAYPEHPSPKVYGEEGDAQGREFFKSSMNKPFGELLQAEPENWVGVEESPYLQQPLGITYPYFSNDTLVKRSQLALQSWRKVHHRDRVGYLVEALENIKNRFFDVAYATMHTTGQGYMMAFQAAGPHAADRALEALAYAYEELERFPEQVKWKKPIGKYEINLEKQWRNVPKGISLAIGCSTFPTWNSVSGVFASLLTGNTVIMKPHPGAVLPIAIYVAEIQKVLATNGIDPNTLQLAVDTYDDLKAKALAEHPAIKMIDFTGNSEFGTYLENLSNKIVFTEKTGVNSVILDAVDDPQKVANNLAFSVCLYSGQMCTAPQNFFVPKSGIKTANGTVSLDDFAAMVVDEIEKIVGNPKAGPFVLGAIQNKMTLGRVNDAKKLGEKIFLESRAMENPMFPKARTATPLVMKVNSGKSDVFSKELFGPILLFVETENTTESIELSRNLAMKYGAISCAAYTTDAEIKSKIMDEMGQSGTSVSFNLTGGIYVNQNAAFSDLHVNGGNPSGNASLTDPQFVLRRFTRVGFRHPVEA